MRNIDFQHLCMCAANTESLQLVCILLKTRNHFTLLSLPNGSLGANPNYHFVPLEWSLLRRLSSLIGSNWGKRYSWNSPSTLLCIMGANQKNAYKPICVVLQIFAIKRLTFAPHWQGSCFRLKTCAFICWIFATFCGWPYLSISLFDCATL